MNRCFFWIFFLYSFQFEINFRTCNNNPFKTNQNILVPQYCQHGHAHSQLGLFNYPSCPLERLLAISGAHAAIFSKGFMGLSE